MRLEVDGQAYLHFLDAFVEIGIDVLVRRFEFTAATRGIDDIPFRPGQACRVLIDEEPILTGWIERIEIETPEAGEEVTYTVKGGDKLVDVVDSQVDGLGESGSTVARVADSVLRYLGIDAKVIDLSTSGSRPFGASIEIAAPEVSETAADYLWGVASRRQVLLASDGDGNLVIQNGDPEPIEARLVHRVDGQGNNLLGFRIEVDHTKRFHVNRVVSQPNAAAASYDDVDFETGELAAVTGEYLDPSIRTSRRRTIAGEASYTAADARSRGRWEANLARAEGLVYTATVEGWRDPTGALWRINTAPKVEDEFAGLSARMMISHLRYVDSAGGPSTILTLRRLDAYQSQAALNELERRAQAAADRAKSDQEWPFKDVENMVLP